MQRAPEIIDTSGRALRLGGLLGAGGEGAVYEMEGAQDLVAKIYFKPLSAERAAKIKFMPSMLNDAVSKLAAWPKELVLLKASRAPIGLIVPRVRGSKDIHDLYGPKSRLVEFPRADWRFLMAAAANTSRAFAAVHSTGCVIGDVNERSVLVAQDATVRLIDCDSFQVISNGVRDGCEVGVESFTPPELQGRSLRGIVRNTNHDNFGLAVMIFQLLFMGRHPFSGRYLGKGQMEIPQAIQETRFAYGAMRLSFQMEKPPGTPSLSIVGDEVAFLFERAFAKQMIDGGRPSPIEWIEGLKKLEKQLKQCNSNPSHWHHHASTSCPWCPMEAATGANLFPIVNLGTGAPIADITAIWRQIEKVPSPGSAPAITAQQPQPTPEAVAVGGSYARANVLALTLALLIGATGLFGGLQAPAPVFILFGAFLSFFGARKWLDKSSDIHAIRTVGERASANWSRISAEWESKAGSQEFDAKKADLLRLRDEFNGLSGLKTRKLDQLRKSVKQVQLERYLDGFEIERASIDGIGNGRKRTLESYGIETAADLLTQKVESVPGFGPVLCSSLYAWRRSLEARFVFNPVKGIDRRDVLKIEQEILAERRRIEQRLRTGFGELRQVHARISATRHHMLAQVESAYAEHLQATANYKAANRS